MTSPRLSIRFATTSDGVCKLVPGAGFLVADQGETALRGFEDPARPNGVHWADE